MKLRLEVVRSSSKTWPWVERLMRGTPGYELIQEAGLEVHAIEGCTPAEVGEIWAVFEAVRGFKQVAVYQNARLLTRSEAWSLFFECRRWTWEGGPAPDYKARAQRARAVRPTPKRLEASS